MQFMSQVTIPVPVPGARRTLSVSLTREGEQTASVKVCRLLRLDMTLLAVFVTDYSDSQTFLASAVDGERLFFSFDYAPPTRASARVVVLSEDAAVSIDLNDGSGGGSAGQPASLAARVRVDGVDAAREVLAVERQVDGAWRIAGSLRTAEGELDLRVTGGEVYALAIDDYGYVYQPNLDVAVGDTIRPTLYAGWLYRITEAGTLPATEPEWWPIDGDNAPRPLGTARAVAVRYYRPLAHGPVPVEMT